MDSSYAVSCYLRKEIEPMNNRAHWKGLPIGTNLVLNFEVFFVRKFGQDKQFRGDQL